MSPHRDTAYHSDSPPPARHRTPAHTAPRHRMSQRQSTPRSPHTRHHWGVSCPTPPTAHTAPRYRPYRHRPHRTAMPHITPRPHPHTHWGGWRFNRTRNMPRQPPRRSHVAPAPAPLPHCLPCRANPRAAPMSRQPTHRPRTALECRANPRADPPARPPSLSLAPLPQSPTPHRDAAHAAPLCRCAGCPAW